MKNFTKAIALCMALLLCLSFPVGVSAAEVADATIDFTQKGSLTIYKIFIDFLALPPLQMENIALR